MFQSRERAASLSGDTSDSDYAAAQSDECKCNNPVVLPKSRLLQAVEMILRPTEPVGRKANIAASFRNYYDAMKVDARCADRSHLPIYSSRILHKSNPERSFGPILTEMRLCLLACDWDGYKDLLLVLFRSSNISNGHLLLVVRSCFIVLFNHPNRTPQLLDDFMASCLYINDQSKRIKYLEGCFLLKNTCSLGQTNKEIQEEEEDEEEIIFNSDFSSN